MSVRRIRRLLAEAIDFGGTPDFINPDTKRKVARHGHAYGDNPAYPKQHTTPGQTHAEHTASNAYPDLIRKFSRYAGIPVNQVQSHQIVNKFMSAYGQAKQIENGHEAELEQLAIDLILGLPQWKMARGAYRKGDLIIRAKLSNTYVGTEGMQMDAKEQEEQEVPEIAQELDIEVKKRKFINMLTHGSAIGKNFSFHLVDDRLNALNPNLSRLYGTIMSGATLQYWMMSDEGMAGIAGGGGGAAGTARLTWENGVPVITATAVCFPVLTQELDKGLMEYLSFPDEEDPETRQYVRGQADIVGEEPWAMRLGDTAWKKILAAIGNDNQDLVPAVYDHIRQMPVSEFNRIYHGILSGDQAVLQWVGNLASELQAEFGDDADDDVNESKSSVIVGKLLED